MTKHETWIARGREITIHTAHDASGRVFVCAMRLPGESTRLLDGRAVDLPRLKVAALREVRDRWGEPGRVRFTVADRRSRTQPRRDLGRYWLRCGRRHKLVTA